MESMSMQPMRASITKLRHSSKQKFTPNIEQAMHMKRYDSNSSLSKNDYYMLESRYVLLEQNFKKLLEDMKFKKNEYQKQKQLLVKYEIRDKKNKAQLQRLRKLKQMTKKSDMAVQTKCDIECCSIIAKLDKSGLSDFRSTADQWLSPQSAAQLPKSPSTPSKRQRHYLAKSSLKATDRNKSPSLAKYKFIPSVRIRN